jgi:hypothetical protein
MGRLRWAAALVYVGTAQFVVGYTPPLDLQSLWMGKICGKIIYLIQEFRDNPKPISDITNRIVEAIK